MSPGNTERRLSILTQHGWWRQATNHLNEAAPSLVRQPPARSWAGATPASLAVATYNIELSRRLDRACRIISQEPHLAGADVLALQEVDEEAVERISGDTFGHVYYAAARHPTTQRNFGPALLTRWPIVDHIRLMLPGHGRTRGLLRIAVRATLLVHDLRIRCYNFHLSTLWEMSARGQDEQARAIAEDAHRSPDPVIIIGDLNRREPRVFTRHGFQWVTQSVGRTHFFWSFDHVFARGLGPARVETGVVARGLEASDHKAVWARLRLCSVPSEAEDR